ncbi:TonB-dependent receptor domain-containing protein, partial [Vibrio parahaemolyticus]
DNWKVLSFEGGVKYHDHGFDASLGLFYAQVTGLVYNDVGVPPVIAGSKTYGAEFQGSWTSDFGFSIATAATLENPKTWAPGTSFDSL